MSKGRKRDARINLAALMLLLGLALIAYRLVDIQVVRADRFKQIAEDQRYQQTDINPLRGCLTDRDGQVLAISKEAYSIYATPYLVSDKSGAAARGAHPAGTRGEAQVERRLHIYRAEGKP